MKPLYTLEEFYEICREAGLNPTDPHDWVNMGILSQELEG